MELLKILLEVVPILLAIVAIPLLVKSIFLGRDPKTLAMAIISCILLIIARFGWLHYESTSDCISYSVFNMAWSAFDLIAVVIYIKVFGQQRRSNDTVTG